MRPGLAQIASLAIVVLSTETYAASPAFPGATPQYRSWTAAAHLPGSPEGLALDSRGRMYVGMSDTGEIVRLDGRGGYSHVATIPSATLGRAGHTFGLEFDRGDHLYVAYVWTSRFLNENDPLDLACRDSTDQYSGVYRVDVDSGNVAAVLTKRDGWPVCFPDDIAVDAHGNLFVTDLTLSGVWKISPDGRFSLWSTDPLLQGVPKPHSALSQGANDLVLDATEHNLYIVTDGNPSIVRIPIEADGTPGIPVAVVGDLATLDGVDLDEDGNIYVSEVMRSEISVFSPDGSQRIVVASGETAPLANPTSLVYRDGVLCTANIGWNVTPAARSVACISGFRRPMRK